MRSWPARPPPSAVPAPSVGAECRGTNGEARYAARLSALRPSRTAGRPEAGSIEPGVGREHYAGGSAALPSHRIRHVGPACREPRTVAPHRAHGARARGRGGSWLDPGDSSRGRARSATARPGQVLDRFSLGPQPEAGIVKKDGRETGGCGDVNVQRVPDQGGEPARRAHRFCAGRSAHDPGSQGDRAGRPARASRTKRSSSPTAWLWSGLEPTLAVWTA